MFAYQISPVFVVPNVVPIVRCIFQARGDVPSIAMTATDAFNGTVAVSVAASLEGIAPLWGTFEVEYGGETTSPLYVDATAGEQTKRSFQRKCFKAIVGFSRLEIAVSPAQVLHYIRNSRT